MIPIGHKYALLALKASAKLGASRIRVGRGLHALHEPPVDLPSHWKEWLGSLEADSVAECRLFLLATAPARKPKVLDEENVWLEHRMNLFYRALALSSVGFRSSYGRMMLGAHTPDRMEMRQTQSVDPIVRTPGTPTHFVVTPAQMRQADRLVQVLWDLPSGGGYGRLWRSLRAFDTALHTNDLAMRLHQLVRAIEGVVRIPAGSPKARGGLAQREWFATKVGLMWDGAPDRGKLLEMYDSRGATEHLELPVRDVQKRTGLTAADAEVPFATLVFLAEGLARHALVRVLETDSLRDLFESEQKLDDFWAQSDPDVRATWGEGFPASRYEKNFDAEGARRDLDAGRADRNHWRDLYTRVRPEYRGLPQGGGEN